MTVTQKLWLNAFLISPILAIYGASPPYLNQKIDFKTFLLLFIAITSASLIIWSIHISLVIRKQQMNNAEKFLTSQAILIILRISAKIAVPDHIIPGPTDFERANILYSLFFLMLPNIVIMILCNNIVTSRNKEIAERQLQDLKLQNSEAQKQVLVQQLQPHFLFNTLSALKSLIISNHYKAEEYVVRLSHFLQYSINAPTADMVDLEKELDFVEDYLALQRLRFGSAFTCTIEIPRKIYSHKLPVFALQTLVENIFKHNHFTEKKPLEFQIKYVPSGLIVTNKKNLATYVQCNNTGLANLNSRYKLLSEKEIIIDESEQNFTVIIPIL
ncbi:sensor histidine kinase [Flavobacterium polysaccharolyticum]|uniref:Histidine kinase n=1 Tax=Flavobacterium polysaccharolyticum TaxID=3133148 RepID=A0ABU9NS23_9FLAO